MKKKEIIAVAVFALVALIAVSMYFAFRPEVRQGSKTVTVVVVYKDGSSKEFTGRTDAEYLADFLVEMKLVAEEEKTYFSTVDGVTADYSADEGWWCISKGGEMCNYGAGELALSDGDVYEITYTIGFDF